MKALLLALIVARVTLAAPVKEIQLSECNVYPAFKKEMIRYQNNGPSLYGVWYYDMTYKHVREVLLTDASGYPVCEKPIQRSEIRNGPRFSLNEQFGGRDDVARDVVAYLAAHEIETCR